MNLGTQTQTLRDFVLCNLQHTLAVPVLVAILENDLDRLEAINKIIIKMDDDAVEGAVTELNQAMRDLGLRRSGFFARNGDDTMWFSFTALPHGSFRTGSYRSGTLHIHALNGAGELYVLSPAARRIANPALASEALALKSVAAGSVVQPVDVTEALSQIRSVLAAAIAESEALVH